MASRNIWVTGSRGFIGKHLVNALRNAHFQVRSFSNNPDVKIGKKDTEPDCFFVDYSSDSDIAQQIERFGLPDIFIHLGWAEMPHPASELHLTENVKAGNTLIETFFRAGLRRFIFVGSMNEYGGRIGPLSEDMPPEGRLTNYARGKIRVADYGFQSARNHHKTFIHIRLFYVYGPGQRKESLINQLHHAYRQGMDVKLGPCEHFRDYIHVLDAVEGIRLISDLDASTTVNLGSGTVIKLKDFVTLFWKTLGADPKRLKFGAYSMREDEPDQPQSYADLSHLKGLTNWLPSLSVEDGIKITIEKLNQSPSI